MPKIRSFDTLNFILGHSAGALPLVMIPFGVLVRFGLLDDRYYHSDMAFLAIVSAYSVMSLIYLWMAINNRQSRLTDALFLVVFHTLALLFVLFVSGFLSAFLAVWILLLVSSDIRFGQKGFLFSFIGLATAGILLILLYPQTPVNERLEIAQGVIIVGAIGYVIARIRSATINEKAAAAQTKKQEVYQRERLLALVNSMGDAVIATDQTGQIKVYNSTLLNLLDTNVNLENKPLDSILKLYDDSGNKVDIFNEANEKQSVFSRTDLTYKFANEDQIKLYINVAPILPNYQSSEEKGFIFILRDITKEKTLEEQRDEFVSVVSHELRTPVTIAEGNLSNIQFLIENGKADEQMISKAAKDAHEQIVYLAGLVNDLSTLAKAERGTGGEIEQIDVNAMLKTIHETYSKQADAKELSFKLNAPEELPQILTNRLYLQEILQNLITNAIKYTQKGGVELSAHADSASLLISIKDTGIGIGNADKRKIFQKFYRSEDYRTRETSGTGLGLYVCKKLCETLGYKLTFESELNKGSEFKVEIPISVAPNPKP